MSRQSKLGRRGSSRRRTALRALSRDVQRKHGTKLTHAAILNVATGAK